MPMFSMDSPMMKAFNRLGEMILLNLFFLFSCIPILTIGAAFAALYDVCFRIGTEREGNICSAYFRAFKSNFKQATVCWGILIAAFLCVGGAVLLTVNRGGIFRYLSMASLIAMTLLILAAGYVFPLISRFQSATGKILKNSLVLCVVYFPRSLCMMVLNLFPVVIFFLFPGIFLAGVVAWLFLYFSVAAFLNTRLLRKVFAPSIPEDEEAEDSMEADTSC